MQPWSWPVRPSRSGIPTTRPNSRPSPPRSWTTATWRGPERRRSTDAGSGRPAHLDFPVEGVRLRVRRRDGMAGTGGLDGRHHQRVVAVDGRVALHGGDERLRHLGLDELAYVDVRVAQGGLELCVQLAPRIDAVLSQGDHRDVVCRDPGGER